MPGLNTYDTAGRPLTVYNQPVSKQLGAFIIDPAAGFQGSYTDPALNGGEVWISGMAYHNGPGSWPPTVYYTGGGTISWDYDPSHPYGDAQDRQPMYVIYGLISG